MKSQQNMCSKWKKYIDTKFIGSSGHPGFVILLGCGALGGRASNDHFTLFLFSRTLILCVECPFKIWEIVKQAK